MSAHDESCLHDGSCQHMMKTVCMMKAVTVSAHDEVSTERRGTRTFGVAAVTQFSVADAHP